MPSVLPVLLEMQKLVAESFAQIIQATVDYLARPQLNPSAAALAWFVAWDLFRLWRLQHPRQGAEPVPVSASDARPRRRDS